MCHITIFPKPVWPIVQGPPFNQISCDPYVVAQRKRRELEAAGFTVEEYRERQEEQKRLAEDQFEAWLRGEGGDA